VLEDPESLVKRKDTAIRTDGRVAELPVWRQRVARARHGMRAERWHATRLRRPSREREERHQQKQEECQGGRQAIMAAPLASAA
jgi:hypothetical protein